MPIKPMWAPWRMPYIREGSSSTGCVFCQISRRDDDEGDLVLFRDEWVMVVLNRYPYNNGHLMVMPRGHGGKLSELDPGVAVHLMTRLQQAAAGLERAYGCHGINIGLNQGEAAGAGVADHLHFHVLPRWRGDTNFMPLLADAKVMPEHLAETWAGLRPYFDLPS